MPMHELDWDDMQDIAAACVAPAAAKLLDTLESDSLTDVLEAAAEVRDAAQSILEGRVRI